MSNEVKQKKDGRSSSPKKAETLLILSMMLQGIVFGSLYGWLLQRRQGIKTTGLRKYLGVASTLLPLILIDKDCCTQKLSQSHLAILSMHFVLSLRSWLDRSFASFGPWSADESPSDIALAIAFLAHLRSFVHMVTEEAKGSLTKKLATIVSFALGANLTVL